MNPIAFVLLAAAAAPVPARGQEDAPLPVFAPLDVFALEWASDPQVSPDGSRVVYVRNGFDVMTDATRTDLWLVELDRAPVRHRPLVAGPESVSSPRWSPSGDRLLTSRAKATAVRRSSAAGCRTARRPRSRT